MASGTEESFTTAVLVFPGQGSQHPGMAEEPLLLHPASLRVYDLASDIAGMDVVGLCNRAEADSMVRTDLCQLAVAATSLAWLELLRSKGLRPAAAAGHSMGEYCAACAAGSLDIEETLRLIWARGKAMLDASRKNPGSMLALLGLDVAEVEGLLEGVGGAAREVCVANHNSARQVVLSGPVEGLRAAAEAASARGARAAWLKVGGPFHSPAMREARMEVERVMEKVEFRDPSVPLFSGCTGGVVESAGEVAECLSSGITARVRWMEVQEELAGLGVPEQVEVGPGKVLGRMAARERRGVEFLSSQEALARLEGRRCSGG